MVAERLRHRARCMSECIATLLDIDALGISARTIKSDVSSSFPFPSASHSRYLLTLNKFIFAAKHWPQTARAAVTPSAAWSVNKQNQRRDCGA